MTTRKKTGLGTNPLTVSPSSQGIFHKTETINQIPENGFHASELVGEETATDEATETINQTPENGFLPMNRELDKVTLRIPIELNDWLDSLLKQGKRKHGQKISKEVWVQAALELLRSMPVDWAEVQSIDQMREQLKILENGIQKT